MVQIAYFNSLYRLYVYHFFAQEISACYKLQLTKSQRDHKQLEWIQTKALAYNSHNNLTKLW